MMVAVYTDYSANAPVNIPNSSETCICGHKCYTSSQKEVQSLEKELKLNSKTTNSVNDEANFEALNKVNEKPDNKLNEKSNFEPYICNNCTELNSKLQSTLQELKSVNLINKILQEQIKSLSQTFNTRPEESSIWTKVNGSITTELQKTTYAHMEPFKDNEYTVQTTNRFAVLSNFDDSIQQNRHTYSSNLVQTTKRRHNPNNKYYKVNQAKKFSFSDYCKLPTLLKQDNSNLHSPKKNMDIPSNIPTIINGAVSVSSNHNLKKEDSVSSYDSNSQLINNLSDQVNMLKESKSLLPRNHKIVSIADSHIRGYANSLKPILNSDYDLYCAVKSRSSELN